MRRKVITASALAIGALCAWVAAPALSLHPYQPAAIDFEAPLPQPERAVPTALATGHEEAEHEHPAARWITPPVSAPHRFDLVGVAGELRELEIRVRDDGGSWTEWVTQVDATPIWVDGADEVQVRAPFRPRGTLHFVNVSGEDRGTVADLLNDARAGVNSAFVAVANRFVAEAEAPKPKLVTRGKWGANDDRGGCRPRGPAEYGTVRSAVIHHTVNANDYSKSEAAGIVLGICRFHVNGNGWNDIGYQALVDRFGRVYKGRAGGMPAAVVGAQAQGFNDQTTAIASIGTNSSVKLSRKARVATGKYVAWKLGVHGIDPASTTQLVSGGGSLNRHPKNAVITVPRVIGHRDLGLTECPGDRLYAQVRSIRKAVKKRARRFTASRPRARR